MSCIEGTSRGHLWSHSFKFLKKGNRHTRSHIVTDKRSSWWVSASVSAASYTNWTSVTPLFSWRIQGWMRVWPNRNGRVCVWGIERSAPVRPQQDIRNLFSNSKIYMSLTTPLLCVCALCVRKMEKHRENTLMGGGWGESCLTHVSPSTLANHGARL